MAGLDPAIHVFDCQTEKTWMPGTSCAKTRFVALPGDDDALSIQNKNTKEGNPNGV
jgi:hypothetical protein